tara:strand:+ start:445 stop:780 length:336 start_codon:yes stop_codon:yes gene_type:complete
MAGITIPENIHGSSIWPLLNGDQLEWRKAFVYEGLGTYGGALPNLTVINQNFRYIETFEDSLLEKVVFREFYDQKKDPLELHNLIGSEKVTSKVNEAQKLIKQHKQTILQQ